MVEMRGGVTDAGRTNDKQRRLKIELLSQWKLEAEFRKNAQIAIIKSCDKSS